MSGKTIQFNGENKTVAEWARQYGIPQPALTSRLKSGWSVSDALTKPVKAQSSSARVTKTTAERWLDGLKVENLPEPLREIYNKHMAKKRFGPDTKAIGRLMRESYRKEFDKWFDNLTEEEKVCIESSLHESKT